MLIVMGIDGDRSAADLLSVMNLESLEEDDLTMVGKNGDITYYAITKPDFTEILQIEFLLSMRRSTVDFRLLSSMY